MKRSKKITLIIFFIVFFLCFVDLRPLFSPKKPNENIISVDETRKNYNSGSCYDMQDDLCYLVVFLDDNDSIWNEKDKKNFIENKFIPSMEYLSDKAMEYNTVLDTTYNSYPDENAIQVTYNGIIESEVVENGSQKDILSQISQAMGYNTPKEMNEALQENFSVKQIAYLVVLNKEGRSYKYAHTQSNTERYEFCVFFNQSIGFDGENCYSTIAHEVLHLFGAEDYYDPYGEYPEREKLAEKLYPNDIMFGTLENINDAEIGNYTAYSVGWTDTLPEECDQEKWWK